MTAPLSFFPVSSAHSLAPNERCAICLDEVADEFGMPIDAHSLIMHSRYNVDSLLQWEWTWFKSFFKSELACVIHRECLEETFRNSLAMINTCPSCRQPVEIRKLRGQLLFNYSASIQFVSGLLLAFNLIFARNGLRLMAAGVSDVAKDVLFYFNQSKAQEVAHFLQTVSQSHGAKNVAFNLTSLGLALVPSCLAIPLMAFKRIHLITLTSPEVVSSITGASLLLVLDLAANTRLLQDEFDGEASIAFYFLTAVLAVRVAERAFAKLREHLQNPI